MSFEPSPRLAAFASAAYTAQHAITLITDHTSTETACDAVREAILRSLPLSNGELALGTLLRDQDDAPPPTIPRLLFDLQAKLSQLRLNGSLVA